MTARQIQPYVSRRPPGVLPQLRLGVFRGGAFEEAVLDVTELTPSLWAVLRCDLERTGLVTVEKLNGIGTFVGFHPTLCLALWPRLSAEKQSSLTIRHQEYYYALSSVIYSMDGTAHTFRTAFRYELPNYLGAANCMLDTGNQNADGFVGEISHFLDLFGFVHQRNNLLIRAQTVRASPGSEDDYSRKSALDQAIYYSGNFAEAATLFIDILKNLGPHHDFSHCISLQRLARCQRALGQTAEAQAILRQALAEAEHLETSWTKLRLISTIHADLADTFLESGDIEVAEAYSEAALILSHPLILHDSKCFSECTRLT